MLFKLIRHKESDGGLLGYKWIEVLANEPFAIREKTDDWGDWCKYPIAVQYVCRTEMGLSRIMSDEIWDAVDQGHYYEEGKAVPPAPRKSPYYEGPYDVYENEHGARFELIGEEDDCFLLTGPDEDDEEVCLSKETFLNHFTKVSKDSDPELN